MMLFVLMGACLVLVKHVFPTFSRNAKIGIPSYDISLVGNTCLTSSRRGSDWFKIILYQKFAIFDWIEICCCRQHLLGAFEIDITEPVLLLTNRLETESYFQFPIDHFFPDQKN